MRPRLVHPVEVIIYRIDKTETQFDPDFREPIGGIQYEGEPVKLNAQVKYDSFTALNMVAGGNSPSTSGHLVVYEGQDNGIGIGDKITNIGGQETELYITEKRPAACYGGKARLTKVLFEARRKG